MTISHGLYIENVFSGPVQIFLGAFLIYVFINVKASRKVPGDLFFMIGIDEIAIQHELPFAVLPLHELCVASSIAVADAAALPPLALPESLAAAVSFPVGQAVPKAVSHLDLTNELES